MLNDEELGLLDGVISKPNLSESLDRASRTDPDQIAESIDLPVSHETYQSFKPEIERNRRLADINPEKLEESHPKTTQWLTDSANASVAIDDIDILKGLEDSLREPERGFWNNAARGGLDSINSLTGNLVEFVGNVTDDFDDFMVNTVGAPNPGIVFGEDGISWEWDVPPEITGIAPIGKAISEGKGYDYQGRFTWENLKGDVTPTNLAGYVAEQGIQSIPHMLATLYTLPAYIASRTESIAEERVANDDRDQVTSQDLITSVVPATAVALMERLGTKMTIDMAKTIGTKGIAKATGKAAAGEGITEFVQEGIEYTGETLGTEKDFSVKEMLDRQFAGLVAGAGMGGTIRATTSTIDAIRNRTEGQIKTTAQSMSEQQTIDQIVSYAQPSKTNGRAPAQFESFIESLGQDREVIIPSEIAEQLEGAPDYIKEQINALGTSISIPMKKFASEIATNEEWMNIVRPHIKLSENTMTQSELDSGERTELQSLLKKAQEAKETLTETDKVYETVKDQIKATGLQGEATARYSAQLYPAAATVYVEKARKAGHDVSISDVFDMMGFRVEAGEIETNGKPGTILEQAIPADLEITMESEIIETGEMVQETFNAKQLDTDINDKLDSYKRLRDCLG